MTPIEATRRLASEATRQLLAAVAEAHATTRLIRQLSTEPTKKE